MKFYPKKEKLIKSKKYIIALLSNKYYFQKVKLCLIRQQYLNKYENSILNYDKKIDNKETKFLFTIKESINFKFKELKLNMLKI